MKTKHIKPWLKSTIAGAMAILTCGMLAFMSASPALAADQPFVLNSQNNYSTELDISPTSSFISLDVTSIPPANTTVTGANASNPSQCVITLGLTQASPSANNTITCAEAVAKYAIKASPGVTISGILSDL